MSPTLHSILSAAVTVAIVLVVLTQCRKPRWLPGRLMVWMMNRQHAGVTSWGLGHVTVAQDATILDVGCGGGRTIRTLAGRAPQGKVFGLDHSAASLAAARAGNAELISSGRVELRHGSVSHLPFPDATFDLVSAVETHYYWPDPVADFCEVLRVLKPGGTLALIAETYRGQRFDRLLVVPMKLLRARYLTLQEHRDLLAAAGFAEIEIHHDARKGWIACVARRPVAPAGGNGETGRPRSTTSGVA